MHEPASSEHEAILRILTADPQPPDNLVALPMPCDGTMTCECPACDAEKAFRVRRGIRSAAGQPWHAKKAA